MNSGFLVKFAIVALVALLSALPAFAADINVDSGCSLIQAIKEANGDTSGTGGCEPGDDGSGTGGADKIILSGTQTVIPFSPLPEITSHVTISGDGNLINLNSSSAIKTSAASNLTLENISLTNGGNRYGTGRKVALELGGSATLTQVLIEDSLELAVWAKGDNATYSFTNIVINGSGSAWDLPSALWLEKGQATVTNFGISGIQSPGPMIKVDSGAQLTLAGCKTIGKVLNPAITGGAVTDNSGDACLGAIGNGKSISAVPVENPPTAMACGFPRPGGVGPAGYEWVNVPDGTGLLDYTLTGDCVLTKILYIPSGVRMRIQSAAGQKYTITALANFSAIISAGDLTLKNVELVGAAGDASFPVNFLAVSAPGKLVMEDSTLRSADGNGGGRAGVAVSAANATFERVTFSNLRGFSTWKPSGIAVIGPSTVTIVDSTFSDNANGPAVIYIPDSGASVRLLGTNTFTSNTPKDIHDPHSAVCEGAACPAEQPTDPQSDAGVSGASGGAAAPSPPGNEERSGSGGGDSSSGGSSDDESESDDDQAPAQVIIPTCLSLPDHISVRNITHLTQCQQVDAAGIGNAAVLDLGFRDGVDIWGWVLHDTQICFEGNSGSFRFLDAATSPRAVSELPALGMDGMICTTINRAGTVALVNGPPVPAPSPTPPVYQSLSGCMVRTTFILNMRAAPAGDVIGAVPYNATLTALERTDGWFKVDYHGAKGWISAAYVEPVGACG